jgi:MFS family permease
MMHRMTGGVLVDSALVSGDLANALRVLVIFGGGAVIGGGSVILAERARHYRQMELGQAVKAMWALIAVNALVLGFITLGLLDRWDAVLSWRWAFAIAIFALKGLFFYWLRSVGLEQERRALFVDPSGR